MTSPIGTFASAYVDGTAPVNTVAPVLTPSVGYGYGGIPNSLSCSTGSWSGTSPITYSYQWQSNFGSSWNNISGETSSTTTAHKNTTFTNSNQYISFRCVVMASNSISSEISYSNTWGFDYSIYAGGGGG